MGTVIVFGGDDGISKTIKSPTLFGTIGANCRCPIVFGGGGGGIFWWGPGTKPGPFTFGSGGRDSSGVVVV